MKSLIRNRILVKILFLLLNLTRIATRHTSLTEEKLKRKTFPKMPKLCIHLELLIPKVSMMKMINYNNFHLYARRVYMIFQRNLEAH